MRRFQSMRRNGGVLAGGQAWDGMQMHDGQSSRLESEGGGSGSRSTGSNSSVVDEVFSPPDGENGEEGGESSENSPVEMNEADKLNYLAF